MDWDIYGDRVGADQGAGGERVVEFVHAASFSAEGELEQELAGDGGDGAEGFVDERYDHVSLAQLNSTQLS